MLPPDYFTNKEDRLLELYRQLEDFILKDITRRLLSAGEMTATTDRLIWKLKQMGESQAAIEQKLRKLTGLTQKELRALLQDAVLTSWEDDTATLNQLGIELSNPLENAAVIRVMDAEYKKSLGELQRLTRTTMKQSQIDLSEQTAIARNELASAGIVLGDKLLAMFVSPEAEKTSAAIDELKELWPKAVNDAVQKELKRDIPDAAKAPGQKSFGASFAEQYTKSKNGGKE